MVISLQLNVGTSDTEVSMSPFTVRRCGIVRQLPVERSTEMRMVYPEIRDHRPKVVVRRNGMIVRTVYSR